MADQSIGQAVKPLGILSMLPPELITSFLAQMRCRDLVRAVLTCKTFYHLGNPLLYRHIILPDQKKSDKASSRLRRVVVRLIRQGHLPREIAISGDIGKACQEDLDTLDALSDNITQANLSYDDSDESTWDNADDMWVQSPSRLLGGKVFPRLRDLALSYSLADDWDDHEGPFSFEEAFEMPVLERVQLSHRVADGDPQLDYDLSSFFDNKPRLRSFSFEVRDLEGLDGGTLNLVPDGPSTEMKMLNILALRGWALDCPDLAQFLGCCSNLRHLTIELDDEPDVEPRPPHPGPYLSIPGLQSLGASEWYLQTFFQHCDLPRLQTLALIGEGGTAIGRLQPMAHLLAKPTIESLALSLAGISDLRWMDERAYPIGETLRRLAPLVPPNLGRLGVRAIEPSLHAEENFDDVVEGVALMGRLEELVLPPVGLVGLPFEGSSHPDRMLYASLSQPLFDRLPNLRRLAYGEFYGSFKRNSEGKAVWVAFEMSADNFTDEMKGMWSGELLKT